MLTLGVQGAGRFVEDKHGGVFEQGAGNGNPLFLSTRKPHSPFTNPGLVGLGKRRHELICIRGLCRGRDFIVGRIESTVTNVFAHRSSKQDGLLTDNAHLLAQPAGIELGIRMPVQ